MNEDNLVTYNTQTGQVEFLNKTVTDKSFDDYLMNTVTNEELGLKQGSDTIASGYNKSIDYVEEYLKEYPAIPMYVGDDPIFPTLVENDKIRHKMQQSINDTVEAAKKYYFSNEGVVQIEPTGDNVKVVDSEVENIAYQNSENLQYLKFPNISVDLSKLSLKEVTEYFKQCNPIPIKRDSVAEFEKNSLNRRYSVS
jgi:hypothetical protein